MKHSSSTSFPSSASYVFEVSRNADVILARQAAIALGERIGLPRVRVFALATAVSELAANMLCHTREGGTIFLSVVQCKRHRGRVGIEVVAADQGPGIPDVSLAMMEGYSTNHGLGGGLPGVRRLMDELEIESCVDQNAFTRVTARLWRSQDETGRDGTGRD